MNNEMKPRQFFLDEIRHAKGVSFNNGQETNGLLLVCLNILLDIRDLLIERKEQVKS